MHEIRGKIEKVIYTNNSYNGRMDVMAMINCPECGKEISDKANMCPNCGYQVKGAKKKLSVKGIGIIVIAILFVFFCLLFALSNRLSDTEQADVDRVITAITNIGEVKAESDSKIVEAEKMYDELSKKCQRHVENRKELLEARDTYNNLKAEETMKLISQIGEVTLSSQEIIAKANNAYDALSNEQKKLVNNSEDLLSAADQLSDLKIDAAETKISAIGTIMLDSENKIKDAREAYDALSDEEKAKVVKYTDLINAEAEYEKLSIVNCISLINAIGTVSLNSKGQIDEAKRAYDSLSNESKSKITNYSTLKNADQKYMRLVKEEEDRKKTINPGDSFKTSNWEVIYKKTNITAKILPNSTSGYYMYYYADDDETFIDIVLQIKNVNTDILGIEDMIGNCEVEYDGNTLTKNYSLYTSSGSHIDRVYMWDGLDALDSTTLHIAITMPRELQTNEKSVSVRLTIAGEEKMIHVR